MTFDAFWRLMRDGPAANCRGARAPLRLFNRAKFRMSRHEIILWPQALPHLATRTCASRQHQHLAVDPRLAGRFARLTMGLP